MVRLDSPGRTVSEAIEICPSGWVDLPLTDLERMIARHCPELPDDQCWPWGGVLDAGYGRLHIQAHRFMYEYRVGPIPDGLVLDHLCMNKQCVNPKHLEPVTDAENLRRAPTYVGNRTHCPRGHDLTVEENLYRTGRRRAKKRINERICRVCRFEKYREKRLAGGSYRRRNGKQAWESAIPPATFRPWVRWTPERQEELIQKWNDGQSPTVIGMALGLTVSAVYAYVTRLRQAGRILHKRKLGRPSQQ